MQGQVVATQTFGMITREPASHHLSLRFRKAFTFYRWKQNNIKRLLSLRICSRLPAIKRGRQLLRPLFYCTEQSLLNQYCPGANRFFIVNQVSPVNSRLQSSRNHECLVNEISLDIHILLVNKLTGTVIE